MARLGTMHVKKIDSTFLGEEKEIKIYIPKEFDFTYETICCFMQDGDDYFQLGRIATLSDKLHDNDTLHNTVFIGIHYKDREDRLKKYHPDGQQYKDYQQFLMTEVIPAVEDILPINPLGIARVLLGDSLAGTFAITLAATRGDAFSHVIMQSPLIDNTVMQVIKDADLTSLSIYHSIGLKETEVFTTAGGYADFITPNKQIAKHLQQNVSDYVYSEIAEGNHTWKYWQKELPEVLEDMLG